MTDWNVDLRFEEVSVTDRIADQIDELFEPLLPFFPTATFGPGRLSVSVTVNARTPETALRFAKKEIPPAMERARFGRGRLVGVEMYTSEELNRLNQIPNHPEVVGVAEVSEMLGVSKQRVSELARSRTFPHPLYELAAGPIWVKGTIEVFEEKWERKPGRPKKTAAS